jgi:hypothetical protein
VNEILEAAIGGPDSDVVPPRQRQTHLSAAELAANPEYVVSDVYDTLPNVLFPLPLPFDLWREQVQIYLDHLGVTRDELMRTFQKPSAGNPAVPTDDDIAAQVLGLTDAEVAVLVGEPSPTLEDIWGTNDVGVLQSVDQLMRRAGITFEELEQLLAASFVSVEPLQIHGPEGDEGTCDPTQLFVSGLNADILLSLHQLLRLWRKLGWAVHEVDQAIHVLGNGSLGRATLAALAAASRVRAELKLPVDQLLSFWGPIDADGDDPLYRRVFQNKTVLVVSPDDDPFEIDENTGDLPPGQTISGNVPAILAALRISARELELLTTTTILPAAKVTDELNLSNLSQLFRYTRLAQGLKITLRELLLLEALTGVEPLPPFLAQDTLAFLERVRHIRRGPLKIPQLAYLFLHREEGGTTIPPRATVFRLVESLQEGLSRIAEENRVPATVTRELLQQKLELAMPVNEAADALAFIDSVPVADAANRGRLSTLFPFLDATEAADNLLVPTAIPDTDEAARIAFRGAAMTFVATRLLAHLQVVASEAFVVRTLADSVGAETALTQALLEEHLVAETGAGKAMVDFRTSVGDGLTASYFPSADLTGTPVTRPEAVIDFDWGAGTPDPSIPVPETPDAPVFSARWKGRVFAPAREAFTFTVRSTGGVRLTVAGKNIIDAFAAADLVPAVRTADIELGGPDTFYDLELEFRSGPVPNSLQLGWSSRSTPEAVVIPGARLFTSTTISIEPLFRSYLRLHKVALMLKPWKASPREIGYLKDHAADFDGFDLSDLPLTTPATPLDGGVPFRRWERLVDVFALWQRWAGADVDLFDVFARASAPSATLAEVLDPLASISGWDRGDLDKLVATFGFTVASFANEKPLLVLGAAVALRSRLGVPVDKLVSWAREAPTSAQADDVKQAAKARHSDEDWLTVAKPLRDPLREKQRDALVAFLVWRPGKVDGASWHDVNGLYDHFLIDVEMSACMLTSRIKQAISSVQLFIQRSLMHLPDGTNLDGCADQYWKWMRNYRVWEANRRVFVYPENYIEPELRDDKSPFFVDLENELRQNEITPENVEAALVRYLEQLDEVSRLEIVGFFQHEEDSLEVLHVFGRTRGTPHVYYHRRREGSGDAALWTAWMKVDVDIEGDHLIPVVYNRRLHLLWPVFTEKAVKTAVPVTQTPGTEPKRVLELQLAWSELKQGRWSAKRVSKARLVGSLIAPQPDSKLFAFKTHENDEGDLLINCYANFGGFYPQFFGNFRLTCNGEVVVRGALAPEKGRDGVSFGPSHLDAYPNVAYRNMEFIEDPLFFVEVTFPDFDRLHLPQGGAVRPALNATPGTFILPHAHQDDFPTEHRPLFYEDTRRNFFLWPKIVRSPSFEVVGKLPLDVPWFKTDRMVPLKAFEGLGAPSLALAPTTAALGFGDVGGFFDEPKTVFNDFTRRFEMRWQFESFYHPYSCAFLRQLKRFGLAGLYLRAVQASPDGFRTDPVLAFSSDYQPDLSVVGKPLPIDEVDFSLRGAHASYNWELFFHAPLLIAERLKREQRFEEAQQWYHYIFDPTDRTVGDKRRFWRVRPFFEQVAGKPIDDLLKALADPSSRENAEMRAEAKASRENPFKPHVLARLRPTAYQKAVVMKYIDNLIEWGDQLFRQDTIESINQATLLYLLANELLGPRPQSTPSREVVNPKTFEEVRPNFADLSNRLVAVEGILQPGDRRPSSANGANPFTEALAPQMDQTLFFCVPQNDTLLGYWDRIADRLFKIRHCENIEGVERQLALFEPPIDPALLVRAAAAGVDLSSALNDVTAPRPHYRFQVLLAKAMEFCADVRGLGDKFLNALEKRDAEALSLLRSDHETSLLTAIREVRKNQVDEAAHTLASLQRAREVVQLRHDFYAGIEFMNDFERGHLVLTGVSAILQAVAQVMEMASGTAALIPDVTAGGAGWAGSPVALFTYGGGRVSDSLQGYGRALNAAASIVGTAASMSGTLGSYQRRADEWKLQADTTAKELEQLDRQILAAEVRKAIADKELENHDLQIEQARTVHDFLRDKFTSRELYDFMVSQLSSIYFQGYKLAYDLAKRAERAFQFERSSTEGFVQFGYWDSLKKGLMAGEKLYHDLKRIDLAYLDQNRRELEITKHVSLALAAPDQLVRLRQTGECTVHLDEVLFDLDYPGHYLRRLKSVAISIPAVTGPYTSVNCTLTLVSNSVRRSAELGGGYARASDDGDLRFADSVGAVQSIVTSGGQNDAGLFEANLRDERYLPFEGAGAISDWHIELPRETNQFDRDTITDVVLHVRYTARDGGLALRRAALEALSDAQAETPPVRLFSVRHEMPSEWAKFFTPSGGSYTLTLPLVEARFPFLDGGRERHLGTVRLGLRLAEGVKVASGVVLTGTLSGASAPLQWQSGPEFGPQLAMAEGDLHGADPGTFSVLLTQAQVNAAPKELQIEVDGVKRLNPEVVRDLYLLVSYTTEAKTS